MVDKTCEKCGEKSVAHNVQHRIRRLPRVLMVHIKRFRHESLGGGKQHSYTKLHTLVDLGSGDLRLESCCLPKRRAVGESEGLRESTGGKTSCGLCHMCMGLWESMDFKFDLYSYSCLTACWYKISRLYIAP